jgi:hypothetical protein
VTTPSSSQGLGLDVAPGGQILLQVWFRSFVGSSVPLGVSGVTVTVAPAIGGSAVVGPTSTGVVGLDSSTYTYTWAPPVSLAPGDYKVTWAASSPSGVAPIVETVTVVRPATQSPAPGVYATVSDYQNWSGDLLTPAARVSVFLRRASEVIDVALVGAVYATDADSMPTDPSVIDTFMRATCAQTGFELANNDPNLVKDQFSSTNVGGVSLTRAAATTARALPPLAPRAAAVLRTAGVLPSAPLISW